MKKIIIALTALSVFACTNDDYEELNIDPKKPTEVPGSFLFTNGVKSLFDQMGSTSVNRNIFRLIAQQWTECQYTDETNYDLNNRSIPAYHWNEMYTDVLYDLKRAKESISNDLTLSDGEKKNQSAIITIVEVYTWQQLVDTFGDIPYSAALAGTGDITPVYDDAETIYTDLLTKITAAYSEFDENANTFDNDFVYNNDISKWKKLAASLRFKLAMRLADSNPSVSKSNAEAAIGLGLISSNDDNFELSYESNSTNANPLYADLVLSGRQDFVPANTFVDYLNELEDPRRTVFFDNNKTPYVGGIYGDFNTYTEYTHIGTRYYESNLPGDLMDFAEISFLLAEASERGYTVSQTAAEYYNQGITASMEYWGISGSDIETYLSRADVAYATAQGTWKEKIAKQFWIAMYNRGFEAWSVWRKFDAPQLKLPAASQNPVPFRYTYPLREVNLNSVNVESASAAIGGDSQQTKLFWDKN